MSAATEFDVIVIGGGFFGSSLALHMKESGPRRVALLEMGERLLGRASYANQARVHNGYHYPRSLLTALRCRVNFPRFVHDYADCIVDDFDSYYAVGRQFSKVTAAQYRQFCERIGAPIERADADVRSLFDRDLIEDVFLTREFAFDATRLMAVMHSRLDAAGVEIRFGTEARRVARAASGVVEVTCDTPEGAVTLSAPSVLNCTYSRLNGLLASSGLPLLYLKHELTEMALVEVPEAIRKSGITVMCGPFFSVMPFPSKGLHSLSHVRYTPHCEWHDSGTSEYRDPYAIFSATPRRTNYPHMIRDAARYVPCLGDASYSGQSLWEVKTVLPRSEVDDSRPVLYQEDHGLPGLTCLMGGKIDNTYDIIEFVEAARRQAGSA